MSEYIQVGKIINTHGIKGEVKVLPLTDDMTRFEDLNSVFIGDNNTEVEIEKVWYKKKFVILKFRDYDNINDVLSFKNKFVLIHESEAVELPEDTYFIFQIVGLEVYNVEGVKIGKIKEVLQPGANDVYVVKDGSKEYLLPAIKEVVKEIDLEQKKMIIDPLEGMIE
ncbi:ribosome maturation factor RimM [Caldisalinibacter kiritimatiensis]|uniref:Ribosome maturation factor RimM n=1 Tax=Caldisalinibacter kiritimatiensis TaxID=1304284 RepID=R1AUY3_9FIRM|nr:ribosome maturation factor RimM [Caldisalinibacter kiritimatiensis]EOD00958.1 16S rRNA processing protein RimM [Caldisalinibacter kiritimatiensis]